LVTPWGKKGKKWRIRIKGKGLEMKNPNGEDDDKIQKRSGDCKQTGQSHWPLPARGEEGEMKRALCHVIPVSKRAESSSKKKKTGREVGEKRRANIVGTNRGGWGQIAF